MAQKTIHATVYDIAIADLLNELTLKVNDAERCQEIIARVASYESNTKLPPEVVDFIGCYAPIEIVDQHGLASDVVDVLKKALDGLMRAIAWIIEKLKEIFKFLFDSQYRACKAGLDIQRRVEILASNPDVVSKFESTNCSIVKQIDVQDIIAKTQSVTHLIAECSNLSDISYIDTLMKKFSANGGVSMDGDRKLVDDIPNPAPMLNSTFALAGWTMDAYQATLRDYIATVRGIEELKPVQSEVEKQAKELKKRAEQAALGMAPGDVVELQKQAAAKILMTKTIGYAIAVSVRRSENVLAFLTQIYKEMHKISSRG